MQIELTDEQYSNLMIFLGRATMKGEEAVSYIQLMQYLSQQKQSGKKPEKVKENVNSKKKNK